METRLGPTDLRLEHVVIIVFVLAVGSAGFASSEFRCPHCTLRFRKRDRCAHCGIAIGTPKAAAIEAKKQRAAAPPA
jgi:hypothetical protein